MGYVDSNLMPGEHIVHTCKAHWVIFLRPLFLLAAGVFVIARLGSASEGGRIFGAVLVAAGLVDLLGAWLARWSSEFAVTNKRVILKVGVIRRKTAEIMLTKMEGMNVDQGILGRILDYGTVVPSGTGGSKSPFKAVAGPLTLRKHVYEQTEAGAGSAGVQPA